jgi:glucose dehydrogenase
MRIALGVISLLFALWLVMQLTRQQIQSTAPALAQLQAASATASGAASGRAGTVLGQSVEATLNKGASRTGADDDR